VEREQEVFILTTRQGKSGRTEQSMSEATGRIPVSLEISATAVILHVKK